ncbi:S24 family peptidase [Halomonas sp. LS-001]
MSPSTAISFDQPLPPAARLNINHSNTMPLSTQHRKTTRHNTYAVRIRGNRMCDCNLFDGDVIIIRRCQVGTAQETASAEINHQPIKLQSLAIDRHGLRLLPQDDSPAIYLHNQDMQVLSLVMGVEHHPTEH